jgi:hypothetical protein
MQYNTIQYNAIQQTHLLCPLLFLLFGFPLEDGRHRRTSRRRAVIGGNRRRHRNAKIVAAAAVVVVIVVVAAAAASSAVAAAALGGSIPVGRIVVPRIARVVVAVGTAAASLEASGGRRPESLFAALASTADRQWDHH